MKSAKPLWQKITGWKLVESLFASVRVVIWYAKTPFAFFSRLTSWGHKCQCHKNTRSGERRQGVFDKCKIYGKFVHNIHEWVIVQQMWKFYGKICNCFWSVCYANIGQLFTYVEVMVSVQKMWKFCGKNMNKISSEFWSVWKAASVGQ